MQNQLSLKMETNNHPQTNLEFTRNVISNVILNRSEVLWVDDLPDRIITPEEVFEEARLNGMVKSMAAFYLSSEKPVHKQLTVEELELIF